MNPPVRAGRKPDDVAAIRWPRFDRRRLSAHAPHHSLPARDGLEPRTCWLAERIRSAIMFTAPATHAPHDVEPTSRVRTPRARRLWRDRAGGAFTETLRSLTSRRHRWAPAHRLRVDRPLPLRARGFRVHARRSSPLGQDRRYAGSVRRTRTYEPRRLRRIREFVRSLLVWNPSHRARTSLRSRQRRLRA